MTIYFYHLQGPYGCFSNFSPHPIKVAGERWATVEHFYQAQKFVGTPKEYLVRQIAQAATPEQAAEIGRAHAPRPDWGERRLEVMHQAILAKFTAHSDLRSVLLGTGSEELVEDSPRDYYWGCGADGSGCNQLGKLLMRVRSELSSLPPVPLI